MNDVQTLTTHVIITPGCNYDVIGGRNCKVLSNSLNTFFSAFSTACRTYYLLVVLKFIFNLKGTSRVLVSCLHSLCEISKREGEGGENELKILVVCNVAVCRQKKNHDLPKQQEQNNLYRWRKGAKECSQVLSNDTSFPNCN